MLKGLDIRFSFRWTSLLGILSFGVLVPTLFIPVDLWSQSHFISIAVAFITSFIIWEGSKIIQQVVSHVYPWDKSNIHHLLYEVLGIFILSSIMLIVGIVIYDNLVSTINITIGVALRNIIVSFLLALLFTAVNEASYFFDRWKDSLLEQERLKEESLIAKLESLKKQLDPHFLFNSLSVLSGIVYKDAVLADSFITKLSKVYRYVLEHKEASLVTLREELNFIEAYFFLLKTRFQSGVNLVKELDSNPDDLWIAPVAIQLLIENAVKHNEASDYKPLKIRLYEDEKFIWIENNIQPRKQPHESSKVGLKNLSSRYQYLTDQKIVVLNENGMFKVGLPKVESI